MKLSRIPRTEKTVKQVVNLKESTARKLHGYLAYYRQQTGLAEGSVTLRDVIEQMLIDFMAADKEFQKVLSDAHPRQASVGTANPPSVS